MNFKELKQTYELQKLMGEEHNINTYVLLSQYLILQEGIIIPRRYHSHSIASFFKTLKIPLQSSNSKIFSGFNQSEPRMLKTPPKGIFAPLIPSIKLTGMSTKKEITILHFNNNQPLSYYFHEKRENILLTIPEGPLLSHSGDFLSSSIKYFNYDILNKEQTEPEPMIPTPPIMLSDIIFDLNRYFQSQLNWSLSHVVSNRLKYLKKLGFHIPDKSIAKSKQLDTLESRNPKLTPNGVFDFLDIPDQALYVSKNIILKELYRAILGNPSISYKKLNQEIKNIEKENIKAEKIPDILYSLRKNHDQ